MTTTLIDDILDEIKYYRWPMIGTLMIVIAVLIYSEKSSSFSVSLGFIGILILVWHFKG